MRIETAQRARVGVHVRCGSTRVLSRRPAAKQFATGRLRSKPAFGRDTGPRIQTSLIPDDGELMQDLVARGDASAILRALREYSALRRALPIEFLARLLNRPARELSPAIKALSTGGVVRLDEERGEIELTDQAKRHQPAARR